ITNNGPRTATGINLDDALPAGVTFLPDASSPGLTKSGNQLSVFVGALGAGDSIRAFVAVQPTAAGAITNTVATSLLQTDTVLANNTANVTTTVLKSPSVTVLAGAPSPSAPNQPITFSVAVDSPTVGMPSGMVVFKEGSTVLAT